MNPALPLEMVKLDTKEQFEAEGKAMHNALPHFFTLFTKEGVTVYSVRQGDAALLNLSVRPEGFVAHIVGASNRRPTEEELAAVTKLLAEKGIETRYDPNSMA